jgi:hypothetical protein
MVDTVAAERVITSLESLVGTVAHLGVERVSTLAADDSGNRRLSAVGDKALNSAFQSLDAGRSLSRADSLRDRHRKVDVVMGESHA